MARDLFDTTQAKNRKQKIMSPLQIIIFEQNIMSV